MSITRISAAELRSRLRDFAPEEKARLEALTDEEIERRALADPDAQPLSPEMLRDMQKDRRRRRFIQSMREALLGVTVSEARDLDLPVWEVTDRNGHKLYLKAADVRRATLPSDPASRIVTLDAVGPPSAQASDTSADQDAASRGMPERQTT